MHPGLYKAAMEGNPSFLSENNDRFGTLFQVTPNKNTALHVAAQFHDKPEFANQILTMASSLLTLVNSKRETALLIAARHGRSETVEALRTFSKTLEREDPEGQHRITKELMGMANDKKDTALLEAVRYNHLDILQLLLKEEPQLANVVNESMETPLYLATEKDHHQLVEEILKTCESPAYIGPNGKTALHAAVIRGCITCTQSLINCRLESPLMKKTDKYGWTPLHHAAHHEHTEIVNKLLDRDSSTAYISAVEGGNQTALHLAACKGHIEVMKAILSRCPDCWEKVNSRNQNILHMAVEARNEGIIYILEQPWSTFLLNQKDIDGITPHGLLSAFGIVVSEPITDSQKGSIQELLKKADPITTARWNNIQQYTSIYSSHVIVASLIATVAFAASYTVPGGYHGHEGPEPGMAILARKAAFKAFLIADTLAMMSSCSALLFYFFATGAAYADQTNLAYCYNCAFCLNLIALVSMMLAFVMGTAAVLQHSHELVVSIYVLFPFFLLMPFCFLSKLSKSQLHVVTKAPKWAYFIYCGLAPARILRRGSTYLVDVLQKKLN